MEGGAAAFPEVWMHVCSGVRENQTKKDMYM